MCQGNPVLRVLGFTFLLVAFIAASIAFLAPFWIRNEKADPEGFSLKDKLMSVVKDKLGDSTITSITTSSSFRLQTMFRELKDGEDDSMMRKKRDKSLLGQMITSVSKLKPTRGPEENQWYWEGLWANCQSNFSCTCVFEDDMAIEKASPGWSLVVVVHVLMIVCECSHVFAVNV